MERPALVVDVLSIRARPGRYDLGAELVEYGRRDLIGRAVGAVDGYLQSVERKLPGECVLGEHDVPAYGVVDPVGLADLARRGPVARGPGLQNELLHLWVAVVRGLAGGPRG